MSYRNLQMAPRLGQDVLVDQAFRGQAGCVPFGKGAPITKGTAHVHHPVTASDDHPDPHGEPARHRRPGQLGAAVTWNSSSNPLTVTGYSSTGKGYGTWTVSTSSDGTRYRTGANLWMHNADNHKVYAQTSNYANAGLCVAPQYTSCSQSYYYYNSSETAH